MSKYQRNLWHDLLAAQLRFLISRRPERTAQDLADCIHLALARAHR